MYTLTVLFLIAVLIAGLVSSAAAKQHQCSHCGSRSTKEGSYNRGWNHLCSQAHGSSGHHCMNCHHIDFDVSDERYVATLPKWCDHALRPIDPEYAKLLSS
jgi:hypothetical protein